MGSEMCIRDRKSRLTFAFLKIKLEEYEMLKEEISILKQIDGKLQSYLDGNFRLVELGSGSSQKTRLLIDMLTRLQKHVEYFPIDISKILKNSSASLQSDYKKLFEHIG